NGLAWVFNRSRSTAANPCGPCRTTRYIRSRNFPRQFLEQLHSKRRIHIECSFKRVSGKNHERTRRLRDQGIGVMAVAQGGRKFYEIPRMDRTQYDPCLQSVCFALKLSGSNNVEPAAGLALAKDRLSELKLHRFGRRVE